MSTARGEGKRPAGALAPAFSYAPNAPLPALAERLNAAAKARVHTLQEYFTLAWNALRFTFARPFYGGDLVQQMDSIGVQSLGIVLLTGFFTGMVLALQSSVQLATFGATQYIGRLVAGSLGHLLVQLPPLRALGARFRLSVDLRDEAARRALTLMAPRALGLGASQITFVVITALASGLGVPALAAFTIAFTLLQIPIGVIGVPLGVVLFPSLSRQAASGGEDEFRRLLTRAVRLLIVAMIPVAVLAAVLRTEAVAVLFAGFSREAIDLTGATFLAFLPGLPAHALIAVLARAFYAHQDTTTPVVAAIGAVVVNTVLATLLVGPLGLPGTALAIAIAAWLEAGALAALLRRRLGPLGVPDLAWVSLRTGLAAALAGALALAVHGMRATALPALGSAGGFATVTAALVTMLAVTAAFGLAFVLAALALRIDDLRSIVGLMVDAIRRPRTPRTPAT